MRLRIQELLEERGWTAYVLAQKLEGRMGRSSVYRLVTSGEKASIRFEELQALCDVLGVGPGELFEYKPKRGR